MAVDKNTQHEKFPLPKKGNKIQLTPTKRWIRRIWIGLTVVVVGLILLFFSVSEGFLGSMPDVEELENPNIFVASQIISSDGVTIAKFEKEKVIPVDYQDLPPYLVYALQAKEDERFKEHSGIDLISIFRALRFGGGRGGGSTITQQLAKLLFTRNPSSNKIIRVIQKLKEWSVAVSLEKRYTKEQIITLYFNKFDFLYNANGIEMASRIYFNKHTSDLTLPEAATLVAMLEAPNMNNPIRHPQQSTLRRNVVLKQMLDTGYLTQATYQQAVDTPLRTDYHPVKSVNEGYSAYYKFFLKKEVDGYLADYEKKTGKDLDLYRDGLKIYVTLDSHMQTYAEEAMKEHLSSLQKSFDQEEASNPTRPFYGITPDQINKIMMGSVKLTGRYQHLKEQGLSDEQIIAEFKKPTKLSIFTWKGEEQTEMSPWDSILYHKQIIQAGLMAMEPNTGNIKAWVGGIDWQHFQFDHVKQGSRQVGSTFKPFVYAAAIMNLGDTPCTTISNATYTEGTWSVAGKGGMMTLRDALAYSQNAAAVRLISQVGVDKVIQLAREMGVKSDIPRYNTIALGASDITIFEMLGAYSTFANYGTYTRPEMLWRIEDANGRVIKEVKPVSREVMSEVYAYTMLDMMQAVTDYGTASRLHRSYGITAQVAGKTGTTNNNSDGWFIGITPKLATGVWVGWEDRATHFKYTGIGQGASMALPIWAYFMRRVYNDRSLGISQSDKFPVPESLNGGFNCGSLSGMSSSGGAGALPTMEQVRNAKSNSQQKNAEQKKKENINEKLNKGDNIDFNQ